MCTVFYYLLALQMNKYFGIMSAPQCVLDVLLCMHLACYFLYAVYGDIDCGDIDCACARAYAQIIQIFGSCTVKNLCMHFNNHYKVKNK